MAKRRTGRPCKLTPKLRESICSALRAGNYIETAAIINGVNKTSLYAWLKKGGEERRRLEGGRNRKPTKKAKPYLDFLNAVEKAQGQAEARDVALIGQAAVSQWQAAAWRLERKFPSRWGRRASVEHTGKDGGPIETKGTVITKADLSGLSDSDLAAIKRILASKSG